MKSYKSIRLALALLFLGLPIAAGSQDLAHPTEVPKVLIGTQARKTSFITAIQPPGTWRTNCTNRIASWGTPMTVGGLATPGKFPVRDIRVTRYFPGNPPMGEPAIRELLSKVWQGRFESAECFQEWAEPNYWIYSAVIEYYVGAPGELITDGSHVYLRDYEGKTWFLRLLPAAQ
jgi:hypothetical protein